MKGTTSQYANPMQKSYETLAPNLPEVNEFWAEAVEQIEVHSDSALFGEQTETGLFPPTFQFSDNRQEATRVAHEVLTGKKTSFSTPLADFEDAGVALPADGDMSIICDGDGHPVALISDTHVTTQWIQGHAQRKVVVETFEVIFKR